jgi:C4-type Zn-finger protein
VEGLLNRFLQLLPLFEDKDKVSEVEEKIHSAVEGKFSFTISMTDPSGVSHFIRN